MNNNLLKICNPIPGVLLLLGIGLIPVVKNSLGASIILLLLFTGFSLSVFFLLKRKPLLPPIKEKPFLVFAAGCGCYFLSCIISFTTKHAELRALHELDLSFRFLLIPLTGWLILKYVRFSRLNTGWFNYGFLVATFMALAIVIYQRYLLGHHTGFGATNHHILFGGLSALLAVACLGLPFKWTWLSYLGFFAGAAASFLSTSRGAWPALLLILFVHPLLTYALKLNGHRSKSKMIGLPLMGLGLILFMIFMPSTGVLSRIALAVEDVQRYFINDEHFTSVGFRFEMWKAAWLMFKDQWLLGVGIGEYNTAFQQLVSEGKVRGIGSDHIPHAHNDLIQAMATMGVFGILSYVLILLIPSVHFIKQLLQCAAHSANIAHDTQQRLIGLNLAGLYTTVTFAIAGMSEAFLTRNLSVNYYLFIITLFYVFITQAKYQKTE